MRRIGWGITRVLLTHRRSEGQTLALPASVATAPVCDPHTPCQQPVCDQAAHDAQRRGGSNRVVARLHERVCARAQKGQQRSCLEVEISAACREIPAPRVPASRPPGDTSPGPFPVRSTRTASPHVAYSLPLVAHAPMCSPPGLRRPSSPGGRAAHGDTPCPPPSAAIAAPKCDPQAGRHLQGDTRPRPLRLPLCYVFAVT